MNKVIPAFICVAFILMLTGCKKKKFNDAIYDTIGQKIEMDIHRQDPTQFTILRYIDNPPCTSCQLKLGEWKVYYKKMKKMFGDKVGLYFLTETKNIEDAEGGNLAASKIRNLECPSYEICLIDYGCGKFNRKIHIMEQYP